MGIRPNRDGLIPPVTPDNPETRYSDWLTDLEDSGEIVGGVWKETDAKATSGNSGVTDLAGRVAALETISSTSGTGWAAYKRAGMVTLAINGAVEGFVLPSGYRPPNTIFSPLAFGGTSVGSRFRIQQGGAVEFLGGLAPPFYGYATFITA